MEAIIKEVMAVFFTVSTAIIIGFYLNTRFKTIGSRFDDVSEKLNDLSKEIEQHKLDVARNYVSKKDHERDLNSIKEFMKDGFNSIKESIASLHKRLDRFEDFVKKELDGKEDKRK